MNLPDYNFLSAPLWLVTFLHWLTLTLHFVAMNFVLGGGIVLLFARLENKWQDPVVRKFIKLFPSLMAATITLGVAPLLFVQLTYYQQVYSASIVSAWPWLLILLAIMAAYYLFYGASFGKKPAYGTLIGLALLAMAYVSFVYSATFALAENPRALQAAYAGNQSGCYINTDLGSYVLRWLHMVLGAITVGGFFVGLLGRDHAPALALGKKFYLFGMIAAMVAGLAYLLTLGDLMLPYMRSAAVWVLMVAIILSLASLHFFFKKHFLMAGLTAFLSLFGMVINRHVLRQLALADTWDPATIPVKTAWSPLIVFVVCFVIALGLVYYMLNLFFTDRKERPAD